MGLLRESAEPLLGEFRAIVAKMRSEGATDTEIEDILSSVLSGLSLAALNEDDLEWLTQEFTRAIAVLH